MRALSLLCLGGLLTSTIVTAQSGADIPADPSALGYLNLHQRTPGGLDGRVEFDSYSTAQAMRSVESIHDFLSSFRHLTDAVRPRMKPGELQAIGNTGREMQMIGFHNAPLAVQATLLKQAYLLAQAKYELAQLKFERKQASVDDVVGARAAYQGATIALQRFWDTTRPTD